jgi:DNA-binding MarR family transcriptional regulator
MPQRRQIEDSDYARLLVVRTQLRRFERWSAECAADHRLTAAQHQLLLAVRGHPHQQGPTIGQVADYLLIRHHSAVELVDRIEEAGMITRVRDAHDQRVVRLRLAPRGTAVLESLTSAHLEELERLTPLFESLLGTLRTG